MKKNMTYRKGEKQSIKTTQKEAQTLNLLDKDLHKEVNQENVLPNRQYQQRDRNYKKELNEIMELKSSITEMKYLLEGFNRRFE